MTSPSQPTTMHLSGDEIAPYDPSFTGDAFTMQSEATLSDQTVHPTMATSTSLSAATPRTSRLVLHESASLMDAATAPNTVEDEKVLAYTADAKQFPETAECILQPATTQSSQLDSKLLSKLPRELRDKIYRDAVVEDEDIPIRVTRYVTKDGERRSRLEIEHPLMRVCKQTRQEVADIYYLENTFCVSHGLLEKRAIGELKRFLSPWAERMTKLKTSYTYLEARYVVVGIEFSVSASQGRILVEPETFSAYQTILPLVTQVTARRSNFSNMCFCGALKLASDDAGQNVLGWVQEYVNFILESEALGKFQVDHCWACARPVIV